MSKEEVRCSNCINATLQEKGYSEYTITGIDVSCNINAHPESPFEDDSEHNNFAEKCPRFIQGNPIYIDINGETRE